MIGRVYRGGDVGGLLRYLYGPGRHNEHENPHLVAAWDLTSPGELATLEPRVLSGEGARAVRDFRAMTGSLELATALRPACSGAGWSAPYSPRSSMSAPTVSKILRASSPSRHTSAKSNGFDDSLAAVSSASDCRSSARGWVTLAAPSGDGRTRPASARGRRR